MNQTVWRRKTARLAGEVTELRRGGEGGEGTESKTRIKDADNATRPLDTHTRVRWTVPLSLVILDTFVRVARVCVIQFLRIPAGLLLLSPLKFVSLR